MKRLLPLLASTLAALGLLAHSATEPAPRTDDSWKQRQALLNDRAAMAGPKARVVFIGDSITQGWEGAGKNTWEKRFAPHHAVNLGIGGDRTQHVLWRLDNGNLNSLNALGTSPLADRSPDHDPASRRIGPPRTAARS